MSTEKTDALVLRVVEFSESSVIVTLFTRDFGKVSGLAKGAKRPKSSFESALDLLAVCRIVFLRKSSDALDLLTEAKLVRRFRSATRDLARLYAGYYIAELLSDLTDHGDPHPELFAAADAALLALDGAGDVAAVIARFEMVLLKYLGHLPELDACVECGAAIGETGRVSFGQLAGGVLCTRCKSGKRQVASVRIETIQILRDLVQDNGPWEATTIDRTRWGELRGIVSHYLANLLGKRPRMASYLGMIAG